MQTWLANSPLTTNKQDFVLGPSFGKVPPTTIFWLSVGVKSTLCLLQVDWLSMFPISSNLHLPCLSNWAQNTFSEWTHTIQSDCFLLLSVIPDPFLTYVSGFSIYFYVTYSEKECQSFVYYWYFKKWLSKWKYRGAQEALLFWDIICLLLPILGLKCSTH